MSQQPDPRYWSQPARRNDLPVSQGHRRRIRDAAGHFIKYRGDAASLRRRMRRQYREQFSRVERRGEESVRVWRDAPGFRNWLRMQDTNLGDRINQFHQREAS